MRVVNVPVGNVHGFAFVRGTQGWVLTIAALKAVQHLIARTTLALGSRSVGDCERSSRHSPVHAFLALSSEAVTGAGADG